MASMVMSVSDFCAAHGISRSTFYRLVRDGKAPRVMRIGDRPLISVEAAAQWRKQMESAAGTGTGTPGSAMEAANA